MVEAYTEADIDVESILAASLAHIDKISPSLFFFFFLTSLYTAEYSRIAK